MKGNRWWFKRDIPVAIRGLIGRGTAYQVNLQTGDIKAPRKVLYVDGEMNLEDLQGRLIALMAGMSGLNTESAGENVTLLSRQDQDPNKPFLDIASDEGQSALFERIRRERFDLVILDNFSVLADVADENDAAAMHPVLNFLMKLKTAKVATILVHHSNKGGDSYRGSSKITTTFEVVMGLKRHMGVKSSNGAAMDIQFDKFRGIAGETIQPKTAWLETNAGASVWVWELNEDAKLAEMVKAVQSCRFKTQKELARHLGVATGTVSGWKQRAICMKFITEPQWEDCFKAARGTLALSEEDESEVSDF